MKDFLYIANWKMAKPFTQALHFVKNNKFKLAKLAQSHKTVICPSFVSLYPIIQELQNTSIKVGAQNCSAFAPGAYTGQVSAKSLKEVGCSYCIIGHSERRQYNHETNEEIAQKLELLLKNELQPIICIGESEQAFKNKKTKPILTEQLQPLLQILQKISFKKPIYFAYEPVWAIGSGIIPSNDYLSEITRWLGQQCTTQVPGLDIRIIYGGSVNPNNAASLKAIESINGFLIGSASLDFQKLKKIVS